MRASLVRLRARPASSLSSFKNDSTSTCPRRVGHTIEERRLGLRRNTQNDVNPVLRKVRLKGGDAPAAWTKLDEARLKLEAQKKREQELAQSQEEQLTAATNSWKAAKVKLAPPDRSIQLDRVRPQISKSPTLRNVLAEDHLYNAAVGSATQSSTDVNEVDKWGKSVRIWFDLLQREARLKGDTGIKQVWTLIKEAEVDLPVESAVADSFWFLLLRCEELHDEIVAYAIRQRVRGGKTYPRLYTMIMQHSLREDATPEILRWHHRLADGYVVEPRALRSLAPFVATSKNADGLVAFRTIYSDLNVICDPCYDQLIPALLHAGKPREGLLWHNILQKHNDLPSPKVARSEIMKVFQKMRQDIGEKRSARWRRLRQGQLDRVRRKTTKATANAVEATSATATFTPMFSGSSSPPAQTEVMDEAVEPRTRKDNFFSTLNTMLERNDVQTSPSPVAAINPASSKGGLISSLFTEVRNAGSNGFSDDFCARLYATQALTPSWVSSFIHAFSVKKIGPLALRELALRAGSTEALQYYLADLRAKGVSIGASKFSLVVRKLAEVGNANLLVEVLGGEQHPDDLDDTKLQRDRLDWALEQGDQATTHRTAAIMSMFADKPEQDHANVLLRSHIRRRRIPDLLKFADSMQAQGTKITAETVRFAVSRLLRPRLVGRRPDTLAEGFNYDDLRIVTNIVLRAAEGGIDVDEWIWTELFKRHGMKGLGSLERFCHAGLNCYESLKSNLAYNKQARISGSMSLMLAVKPSRSFKARLEIPATQPSNPMRRLLDARRLQNIVSWGFIEGLRRLFAARDRQLRYSPHVHGKLALARFRRWPSDLVAPPPTQTYLCGLSVLQNLHEKGIRIQGSAIELVLVQRLWNLYGPGRSRRNGNTTAAALNPYGLLEMIRAVNQIWNWPPLFARVQELLRPLPLEELQAELIASQSAAFRGPGTNVNPGQHDFRADLSSDKVANFIPASASAIPEEVDKDRDGADAQVDIFLARMPAPGDPHELQRLRYVRALMKIFYTRKTIGMGTKDEMRAQRAELSHEQWLNLLYLWARRQVHDR